MSSKGFIQIPRSILEDPHFVALPLTYKAIFIKILELMAYAPTYTDVHGKRVDIQPFQVCISMRKLAEETGKEVHFCQIQRALTKFAQINYARHTSIHDRCIITVIHPDICVKKNDLCDTVTDTGAIQERYIKEEYKKDISLRSISKKKEAKKIKKITFNYEDGTFSGIENLHLELWKKSYPFASFENELPKMTLWLLDPKNPKRERLMKFIGNWLKTADKNAREEKSRKEAFDSLKKSPGRIIPESVGKSKDCITDEVM